MKIVNVKKFRRSMIIISLVILGALMICSKASLSFKEKEYISIYVDYGDTLWKIAEKQQKINDYYRKKDIRDIVYDIKKENNLTSIDIYVAQELKIPTL